MFEYFNKLNVFPQANIREIFEINKLYAVFFVKFARYFVILRT